LQISWKTDERNLIQHRERWQVANRALILL